MNKFQKVALQIAKDDSKKKEFKNISIQRNSREWYSYMNYKIGRWSFEKALAFKKWNKTRI